MITERQKNVSALQSTNLAETNVGFVADSLRLAEIGASLRSVDLSSALLSALPDVWKIARALPALESLSVARNRLGAPDIAQLEVLPDSRLRELILAGTQTPLSDGLRLFERLPRLEFLGLDENGIRLAEEPLTADLSAAAAAFHALQGRRVSLSLRANCVESWARVCELFGAASPVREVNLGENPLGEAGFAALPDGALQNLEALHLDRTAIPRSEFFEEFPRVAPHVQTLMTSGAALYEAPGATAAMVRRAIVALVPALRQLNKASVLPKERRNAELFYANTSSKLWNERLVKFLQTGHNDVEELFAPFIAERPAYLRIAVARDVFAPISFIRAGGDRIPETLRLSEQVMQGAEREIEELTRESRSTVVEFFEAWDAMPYSRRVLPAATPTYRLKLLVAKLLGVLPFFVGLEARDGELLEAAETVEIGSQAERGVLQIRPRVLSASELASLAAEVAQRHETLERKQLRFSEAIQLTQF